MLPLASSGSIQTDEGWRTVCPFRHRCRSSSSTISVFAASKSSRARSTASSTQRHQAYKRSYLRLQLAWKETCCQRERTTAAVKYFSRLSAFSAVHRSTSAKSLAMIPIRGFCRVDHSGNTRTWMRPAADDVQAWDGFRFVMRSEVSALGLT